MSAADQKISLYEQALNTLAQASDADFSAACLSALVARDKVAVALRDDTEAVSAASFESLVDADRRLAELATKFDKLVPSDTLGRWRQSTIHDEGAWWWKLDDLAKTKQSWFKRLSTGIAILFVTASVALFADTLNVIRSMGANPVSTFGVLIQGTLAFIAASAFTEAGRKWLIDKFSRFGTRTFKGWARTALAILVFGVTLTVWFGVPTAAAWYFNWKGDKYFGEQLYTQAAESYQQASSLNPRVPSYARSRYDALAKAAEASTDYAKAVDAYKSMFELYERPGGIPADDKYFFGKCGLVRLLISQGKDYPLAEKTIADLQKQLGQVSQSNRRLVQYYLMLYRGWIELDRKNLNTAHDALQIAIKISDRPAARYLLARVFEELKQDQDAKTQFATFLKMLQQQPSPPDEIPLEWISYAQERTVNS